MTREKGRGRVAATVPLTFSRVEQSQEERRGEEKTRQAKSSSINHELRVVVGSSKRPDGIIGCPRAQRIR